MRNNFSKYFVLVLFCALPAWAFRKDHGVFDRKSGASERPDKIQFDFSFFKPQKPKARDQAPKTTKNKAQGEPDEVVYGTARQKSFQRFVLSDRYDDIVWDMGSESGNYYDCSAFVQKVLREKGCTPPNMPERLTTGHDMRSIFGAPKKCQPGDIVHYPGHMGFYHSPGKFLGSNSGQRGVGIHGSSGTCYPNPCLNRFI